LLLGDLTDFNQIAAGVMRGYEQMMVRLVVEFLPIAVFLQVAQVVCAQNSGSVIFRFSSRFRFMSAGTANQGWAFLMTSRASPFRKRFRCE
jgi:hypothetical protein